MSEWKEYKFSDFVSINPSVKLPSNEQVSFVEMKDLEDGKRYCYPSDNRLNGSGSKFENGDTLFARITPCLENGKICQVKGLKNGKGLGSTEFLVFRGKENVSNSDFVFYLSRWNEVRSHAEINLDGTSGRQRVPKECFNDLILRLPENLPEQTAIASVLSSLDDKIDLLHRQNATLEKLAETLFRQWFVEEAKEEWEVVKLKSICTINNGYAFKSETYTTSGQVIVRTMNFSQHYIELKNLVYVTDELAKSFSKYQLKRNDFLLVMVGASLGNYAIVTKDVLPSLQNQNMWAFRAHDEHMQHYLNHALREIVNDNLHSASGSAREFFQKGVFYELELMLPPIKQIERFGSICEHYLNKIENNRHQIRTLTALRDTLLPKLMSGEVRVSEL